MKRCPPPDVALLPCRAKRLFFTCLLCLRRFSLFFQSALTQFFQIFPEYQANDFYATGEVRSQSPLLLLLLLLLRDVLTSVGLSHRLSSHAVVRWKVRSSYFLLHP